MRRRRFIYLIILLMASSAEAALFSSRSEVAARIAYEASDKSGPIAPYTIFNSLEKCQRRKGDCVFLTMYPIKEYSEISNNAVIYNETKKSAYDEKVRLQKQARDVLANKCFNDVSELSTADIRECFRLIKGR